MAAISTIALTGIGGAIVTLLLAFLQGGRGLAELFKTVFVIGILVACFYSFGFTATLIIGLVIFVFFVLFNK